MSGGAFFVDYGARVFAISVAPLASELFSFMRAETE
jgi:hypothetical protein